MTAKNLLSDLKQTLSNLTAQTTNVRATVESIRSRIDALKAEREALLASKVSREDWLNMCLTHVDRKADEYASQFNSAVFGYAQRLGFKNIPEGSVKNADFVMRNGGMIPMLPMFGHQPELTGDPPFNRDFACFLFREPLKEAIRKAVAENPKEWPFRDAKPCSEQFQRLDAIDAEISELEDQEREILAQASAMGLDIPARPALAR